MVIVGIVLNYNNYKETIECVNSLLNLNSLETVIIVDNASTDVSYKFIKNEYNKNKRVVLLKSNINGGYAAGNNIGLKYANKNLKAKYLLVCNPDVRIVSNEVIKTMCDILDESNEIVGIAPKMIDRNNNEVKNGWMIPTYYNDLILSSIILTKIFGNGSTYENKKFDNKRIVSVEVLSGSCFAIKSSFISEIGYLDEGTFLYGEERILAKKIKELGYKQVIVNNEYFHHYHSTTISKNIKTNIKRYKILSNSRYYYQKKYNNIKNLKKLILKTSFLLGMIEQTIIQIYKNLIL